MATDTIEIPVDREVKKAVDEALTLQDRVMLALDSYKSREIYQTIDDIAGKASLRPISVYQTLHRMVKKGQVEILKERSKGGKEKIIGVKLNYAPSPERIVHNGAERAKESRRIAKRSEVKVSATLIQLGAYMEQKIAIEKANQMLRDAGLEELQVNNNRMNPLGEEAIEIYKELVITKTQLGEALVDLEEARRVIRTLKGES